MAANGVALFRRCRRYTSKWDGAGGNADFRVVATPRPRVETCKDASVLAAAATAAATSMPGRPHVHLDFAIDGAPAGRIVVELFSDIAPLTAENFRSLCVGVGGDSCAGLPLHFRGSVCHKINPGWFIQCGDYTRGDGTGGESIYGKEFNDENFNLLHDAAGLLSMVTRGPPNTNNSQFMIHLRPNPKFDGRQVVFGRVVAGMENLSRIEACGVCSDLVVGTDPQTGKTNEHGVFQTKRVVTIRGCGQLSDAEAAGGTDLLAIGDLSGTGGGCRRKCDSADHGAPAKRQQIDVDAEVRVFHILKKHSASKSPTTLQGKPVKLSKGRAKLTVDNLRKRLITSPNCQQLFVELAREHSDDVSGLHGGDLGNVKRGSLFAKHPDRDLRAVRAIEDCAFSLAEGELAELFDSAEGVHLVLRGSA